MRARLRDTCESRVALRRADPEAGASSVEYALLAAAVAGVIALAVFLFGGMVLQLNQDNCDTIRATANPSSTCS